LWQRVGGVGVKNSNPDVPGALISDQISPVLFLSSSVRSTPPKRQLSGAEVHASGDAPFRSTKRGAPFFGALTRRSVSAFPARSRYCLMPAGSTVKSVDS
jgi:hypothetical protein